MCWIRRDRLIGNLRAGPESKHEDVTLVCADHRVARNRGVERDELPAMANGKLTASEIADLKARLLNERAELDEQLTTIEDTSFATTQSDLSGDVGLDDESADAGTATFEREKDLSIEQNVRDLLQKIDRALSRIDAGTYGVCDRCGKPIEKARVKALPYVSLCLKDAQAQAHR